MTYQIHNQDCLEWMRTQPSDSIDTIIFSPPYNKKGFRGGVRTSTALWNKANIDYSVYDDNMPDQEYQQWQIQIVNECHRLIKHTGSIFYQHKIRNWARKGSHPMEWLSETKAQFYQEIVWHRKSTTAIDENYLFSTTEKIYWFCKGKPRVYKSQMAEMYRTDVWVIPPGRQQGHPAPFPEQLVENCLLLTTEKGDLVYDPFTGSGTSLLVAERLGRDSIGTEIDPAYVKLSQDRLSQPFTRLFEPCP
jgi:site-specific DNA-methyltransferase (adenine-specific)